MLQLRAGQKLTVNSRCSEGTWQLTANGMKFSHDIRVHTNNSGITLRQYTPTALNYKATACPDECMSRIKRDSCCDHRSPFKPRSQFARQLAAIA